MSGDPRVEHYTPGQSGAAVAMMAARTLETPGAFFLPHLRPGPDVVDVGCGPGSITSELAAAVAPGRAVGVDAAEEPLAHARERAERLGASELTFRHGSCNGLPARMPPPTGCSPTPCWSTSPTLWPRCARPTGCCAPAG